MASLLRRRPIATFCPIFCRQQLRRYGFRSGPPPPKMANVTFDAGGRTTCIKTGKFDWFPKGSAAVITTGGTEVRSAVECSWNDTPRDYLPFRVEYEEPRRLTWSDKGKGTREGRHLINRLIKPLFPAGFYNDIHVTASVHSSDGMDPDVMAANATSAALMLSDIPWNGPIGVIRVGRIKGKFIVNPPMDVLRYNDFHLVYACTMDKTLMIDGHGWEISEKDLQTGLELAHSEALKYIDPQIRLAEEAAKKGLYKLSMVSDRTLQKIKGIAEGPNAAVLNNSTYGKFQNEVLGTVKAESVEECDEESLKVLLKVVDMVRNKIIRQRIIDQRLRVDGRQLDEVRSLFCDYGVCGILPGSYREIAQALWTVALVTPRYAERLDRHEAVYGTLVEKALLAVLPPEDDFPYDVFIGRKVVGSDGSKSMATVCGASMALIVAGCPLREHVAGVSVGLFSDVDPSGRITRYHILTDLSGFEEHLVDMDFKIAGTRKGITAILLDTIHARIPLDIICQCLEPARRGRNQILDNMEEEMDARRTILGLCDTMGE